MMKNNKTEIIRVFDDYHKLNKKKKLDVLSLLSLWISGEINKLNGNLPN